jgi:hypothetical protein
MMLAETVLVLALAMLALVLATLWMHFLVAVSNAVLGQEQGQDKML